MRIPKTLSRKQKFRYQRISRTCWCPQAELPEFEEGARLKFALKAYDNEELSTGLAARFAGMSREEFIYTMGKYGLSPIRLTAEELRKDVESARKASHQ